MRDVAWLLLLIVVCGGVLIYSSHCDNDGTANIIPAVEPTVKNQTVATVIGQLPAAHAPGRAIESKGEQETRAALFRLFGKPFIKIRPSFIVNPETKRRLELDCYNAELRLGVEYNGSQHSEYPNPFHRTFAEFQAQQRRDDYKAAACEAHGVCLINVPHTVPRACIQAYLQQHLVSQGYGPRLIL